ncbi:MAG: hypothetical protein HQM08_26415 [Candidatus Riflebacteria bacterium]|nr:hypothetical protein [Candidatus Riflebacteria bacterium]
MKTHIRKIVAPLCSKMANSHVKPHFKSKLVPVPISVNKFLELTLMEKLIFGIIFGIIFGNSFVAEAWGPLTHMKINYMAYDRAAAELGPTFIIPAEMKVLFVGGGPCPDIRQTMSSPYLDLFHNEIPAVLTMLEMARNDSRFGTKDIAECLGWAGHLFAEVPSAHTPWGYPNTKPTFSPRAGSGNHSITEFCVDVLTYYEMRELLKNQQMEFPAKLLETAFQNEKEKFPQSNALTASQIKDQANAFLPTIVGIRTIAEYLMRERPELIKEMDEFYADRQKAIAISVEDVTLMLETYGHQGFSKRFTGTADTIEKLKRTPTGSFAASTRNFCLRTISKAFDSNAFNEVFRSVGFEAMKGMLSTRLMRDQFKAITQKLLGSKAKGNDPGKLAVRRFMEGLFLHDFSFKQILQFVEQGLPSN